MCSSDLEMWTMRNKAGLGLVLSPNGRAEVYEMSEGNHINVDGGYWEELKSRATLSFDGRDIEVEIALEYGYGIYVAMRTEFFEGDLIADIFPGGVGIVYRVDRVQCDEEIGRCTWKEVS